MCVLQHVSGVYCLTQICKPQESALGRESRIFINLLDIKNEVKKVVAMQGAWKVTETLQVSYSLILLCLCLSNVPYPEKYFT